MANKILYFTDLEGTILRESDGEFEDMEFYRLVSELTRLGELTDAEVEMRLISPIGFKRINKIVDRMERIILRHSILSGNEPRVELEEAAASSFDMGNDVRAFRTVSKKIIELPRVVSSIPDPAREAKKKYVDLVLQSVRPTDNVSLCIYAGNGRNDISAMKYIKSKKNGIIISPRNSRKEIRGMSHFTSEHSDIKGVIDCVQRLNEKIEERTTKKEESKDIVLLDKDKTIN